MIDDWCIACTFAPSSSVVCRRRLVRQCHYTYTQSTTMHKRSKRLMEKKETKLANNGKRNNSHCRADTFTNSFSI